MEGSDPMTERDGASETSTGRCFPAPSGIEQLMTASAMCSNTQCGSRHMPTPEMLTPSGGVDLASVARLGSEKLSVTRSDSRPVVLAQGRGRSRLASANEPTQKNSTLVGRGVGSGDGANVGSSVGVDDGADEGM